MDATGLGTNSLDNEPEACGFPHETILNILVFLGQRDLVRAQLVCKQWHACAQAARKQAFLRRWGFAELLAEPRSATLYEALALSSIVRRHVVSPGENLPQLALKLHMDPGGVMRLNNLMSPHLLQHRHVIYLPVRSPQEVWGCPAGFEYSSLLCRELLVVEPLRDPLRPMGGSHQDQQQEAHMAPRPKFNRMMVREMQAHVRRMIREGAAGGGKGRRGNGVGGPSSSSEAEAAAAAASVGMSAARYYLEESNGDVEEAARRFVMDHLWELRQAAKDRVWADRDSDNDVGSDTDSEDVSYGEDGDDIDYGAQAEGVALVRKMNRAARRAQGRKRPLRRTLRKLLRRGVALLLGPCGGDAGDGGGASRRQQRRQRQQRLQSAATLDSAACHNASG